MAKNSLEKKIKKALDKATKKTAEELTFQIEHAYECAIDNFYNSYTPSWYNRTYSTYLASDRYDSIYDSPLKKIGEAYEAGININSKNIGKNPYRADKEWVLERTFEKGIHGYTFAEMKKWKYSASKKISVRRDRYSIELRWNKGMTKLNQPPKDYMDKWFKHEITTKRGRDKIDAIFTAELAKALK